MKELSAATVEISTKPTLVALLKFGEKTHLRDLLLNGNLYFSSVQCLRENKDRDGRDFRFDAYEGSTYYKNFGPGVFLSTESKDQQGNPLRIEFTDLRYCPQPGESLGCISSFYGITFEHFHNNELTGIDLRMKEFGKYFILIVDCVEFHRRVESELERLKLIPYWAQVQYFDERQYQGRLDYYQKRSRYKYQKEYRLFLDSREAESRIINVGSLKDIASICHIDNLNDLKMTLDPERGCNMVWQQSNHVEL